MLEPFACKSHVFCLVVCFHFVVCCWFTPPCPAAEGSCPQLHVCLEGSRTRRLQSSRELGWAGGLMTPWRLPSGSSRLGNACSIKHKMNTNISVNWNWKCSFWELLQHCWSLMASQHTTSALRVFMNYDSQDTIWYVWQNVSIFKFYLNANYILYWMVLMLTWKYHFRSFLILYIIPFSIEQDDIVSW